MRGLVGALRYFDARTNLPDIATISRMRYGRIKSVSDPNTDATSKPVQVVV